jgi:hypothetical protein
LKRVIGLLTKPISSRVLFDLEGLDHGRWWNVRTSAQIDQGATSIGSTFATIRDLVADKLDLERIVTKES